MLLLLRKSAILSGLFLNARKKTTEQQKIINAVKQNGKIQRNEVMKLLNCGETKVKELLKKLSETELEKITKANHLLRFKRESG